MAPRRKKGQMRKDAAMDAMRKYGFEDGAINDAIKELLNLYGDDGWMFIEDYAYKELLDKILENNNGQEEETVAPLLEFHGGTDEPMDTTQEAGPSSPARPCSDVDYVRYVGSPSTYEPLDFTLEKTNGWEEETVAPLLEFHGGTDEPMDMTLEAGPSSPAQPYSNVNYLEYVGSPSTDEPLDSIFTNGAAALPANFSSGGPSSKNIELLQMTGSPSTDKSPDCAFTNDLDVSSIGVVENGGEEVDMDLGEDTHVIEAVQAICKKDFHSSVSTPVQVNQTRKTSYGWISKDNVDPSDIITLERAPLPEKFQRLLDEFMANNCMPSWAIMRH